MNPKDTNNLIFASALAVLALWNPVHAQTLDEAVSAQLGIDPNFVVDPLDPVTGRRAECGLLLGGDLTSELGGALRTICERQGSSSGIPGSTGGGAGTATTVPDAVRERMRPEEESEAGADSGTFGLFFSAGFEPFDRDLGRFQDGYDSEIASLTGGFDYQTANGLVFGAAINGTRQRGDFIGGGDFDVSSVGIIGFGSYSPGESTFIEFYAGYSDESHDRLRTTSFIETDETTGAELFAVQGSPLADFGAKQLNAGISAGYSYAFDNVTIGPVLAFDYARTTFDTYSETDTSGLALTFYEDEEVSRLFSAGLEASAAISTRWGVLVAQQNLFWRHESGKDQRITEVSFVDDPRAKRFMFQTEAPDDEYLEYNFGLLFVLPRDVNVFLNYGALAAHRIFDNSQISLGFHKSF